MTEQVQFISTSPDELVRKLTEAVSKQLEGIRSNAAPKPESELLTRTQAAEFLQIDLATVWRWTQQGKIKSYGLGAKVFYKREELEAALKPLNQFNTQK